MNRRQFLQLSAVMMAGAATGSCARLSPRYIRPDTLTQSDEKLLLKNTSIVDVARGELIPKCRILIQGGRILKIACQSPIDTLDAHRELDLGGGYVMPGIINVHCHMSLPGGIGFGPGFLMAYKRQLERNAEECIKHGVTTVRDMLAASDFLEELKFKIAHGEIVGPRIISCCGMDIKDGYGDKMTPFSKKQFWQEVNNPDEGRRAVTFAVDHGADFIKLFQQPRELLLPGKELPVMDTETILAIQEHAARHGKIVALHHTTASGLTRALAAGVVSLEHMSTDTPVPEDQIRRLIDCDHTVVPTASVAFALAYERHGDPNWGKGLSPRIAKERADVMPELIHEFCEPELVNSTISFFKELSDPGSFESWHLLPWPDPSVMNAAANMGSLNTKALYEAGVTFGCGNDGGVPLIFPGAMWLEMVLLEEQGIRTADILKMATINNARLLQMDRELGTVAQGKVADLAIFQKNPLDTVHNMVSPAMVFQAGRLAFRA